MKTIKIRRLTFGSYMLMFTLTGAALGLLWMPLSLLSVLVGNTAYWSEFMMIPATLVMIPVMSLLMVFFGTLGFAWFGLMPFLPYMLLVKVFKRLTFTALVDEPPA